MRYEDEGVLKIRFGLCRSPVFVGEMRPLFVV